MFETEGNGTMTLDYSGAQLWAHNHCFKCLLRLCVLRTGTSHKDSRMLVLVLSDQTFRNSEISSPRVAQ